VGGKKGIVLGFELSLSCAMTSGMAEKQLSCEHACYHAELVKRKGGLIKAGEKLYKATAIFKECGADG
jgi:hypothetical protein